MASEILFLSTGLKVTLGFFAIVIVALVAYLLLACIINCFSNKSKTQDDYNDDWSKDMSFAKDD